MNERETEDLLAHQDHTLVVDVWGEKGEVTLTCEDCQEIVLNEDDE